MFIVDVIFQADKKKKMYRKYHFQSHLEGREYPNHYSVINFSLNWNIKKYQEDRQRKRLNTEFL